MRQQQEKIQIEPQLYLAAPEGEGQVEDLKDTVRQVEESHVGHCQLKQSPA